MLCCLFLGVFFFLPLEKPLSDLCEVRQFHAPPLGPEGGGALGHTDDSKLMSND